MGIVNDIFNRLTGSIRTLVALFFFVFTAGMLFGLYVSRLDPVFLFLPPAFGLLAYYNEKLSLILFVLFLIFLI